MRCHITYNKYLNIYHVNFDILIDDQKLFAKFPLDGFQYQSDALNANSHLDTQWSIMILYVVPFEEIEIYQIQRESSQSWEIIRINMNDKTSSRG
ncbi:hypothetical protein WICPIJ_009280 [Wickerhamomyces pijperi]|uniref:Uncharacterized protein n=1 Tax=Wickerhamomyces pijperi TaxID=599730 RepID=A0A9P8TEL4_WICPI|nr:hypothetical protein WICPIJ_009280 [Wickerhamomyces pijperi]